jgi:hypothetical protein
MSSAGLAQRVRAIAETDAWLPGILLQRRLASTTLGLIYQQFTTRRLRINNSGTTTSNAADLPKSTRSPARLGLRLHWGRRALVSGLQCR